jgi:hypothetical protein
MVAMRRRFAGFSKTASGASSAAFSTSVFPAQSAGAIFNAPSDPRAVDQHSNAKRARSTE